MNHDLILMHDLMNFEIEYLEVELQLQPYYTLPRPAAASRGRCRDIKDTVLRDGVYKAGMTAHSGLHYTP